MEQETEKEKKRLQVHEDKKKHEKQGKKKMKKKKKEEEKEEEEEEEEEEEKEMEEEDQKEENDSNYDAEEEDEGEDKGDEDDYNQEGESTEEQEETESPGGKSKKLIFSTLVGGGIISILLFVVSLSKQVEKGTVMNLEEQRCSDDSTVCPKDWIRIFYKCYYLSSDQKTWNASQKMCRSLGASLATFNSIEEMEFLMKRIGSSPYWFGLITENGVSFWTWENGSSISRWIWIKGTGCAHLSRGGISTDSCMSQRNYMCSKVDKCF